MRGQSNKLFIAGVLLMFFGGAGLAEISTSNHGCFWLCAVMFSVGIGLCLAGYER